MGKGKGERKMEKGEKIGKKVSPGSTSTETSLSPGPGRGMGRETRFSSSTSPLRAEPGRGRPGCPTGKLAPTSTIVFVPAGTGAGYICCGLNIKSHIYIY